MSAIMVFGASGMLGSRVVAEAERRGLELRPWTRHPRIENLRQLALSFSRLEPGDTVINCAGITPDRGALPVDMVTVNAVGPHHVAIAASARGARVIHVSTDCVYSGVPEPRNPGRRYNAELDRPDPVDLYGRSKLAGEVQAAHVVNVRTSFVGPEHGLLAWLIESRGGVVDGYTHAMWTGSTAGAVASPLLDMANDTGLMGTVHLATEEKISKWQALYLLDTHYGLGVDLRSVQEPRIDRALEATWPLLGLAEALEREAAR